MDRVPNTLWRSRVFFVFLFSFMGGIFVSSLYFISPLNSLLLIIIGSGIIAIEKVWNEKVPKEALVISIIILSFALGALRFAAKDFHIEQVPLKIGVIVSEPESKDNSTRFVFKSDNGEKVLVTAPLYTHVEYGDRVEIEGKFNTPGQIVDEKSGRSFNYQEYLAKDDIYYTLNYAEVKMLGSGYGNSLKIFLFKLKKNFVSHIQMILPEPDSSLLAGLIVSGKESLPQNILDDFKRAGVIHIVVLSGYNITIIAEFLRRSLVKLFILLRLPVIPQAALGASMAGIILFVIMTGGEATVVRAAIMAAVAIAAKFMGRTYSAPRALIFAAFLMLLENPKILMFDPSFQLSFLATLGLIYLMNPVESKLGWVTQRGQMREILAQTLSTQLTVLPLLIYSTGSLSLVSIPANILVLSLVPYTMFIGFITAMLSYVAYWLAWPLAFISHLMLSWILFVADILGNVKLATLRIQPSLWSIAIIYLILVGVITSVRWRSSPLPLSN